MVITKSHIELHRAQYLEIYYFLYIFLHRYITQGRTHDNSEILGHSAARVSIIHTIHTGFCIIAVPNMYDSCRNKLTSHFFIDNIIYDIHLELLISGTSWSTSNSQSSKVIRSTFEMDLASAAFWNWTCLYLTGSAGPWTANVTWLLKLWVIDWK